MAFEFTTVDVTDLVDDEGLLTSTEGGKAAMKRCAQLFNEYLRKQFEARQRIRNFAWFRLEAYRKNGRGDLHARVKIEYGDRPPSNETGIISAMACHHYNNAGVRAQAMLKLGMTTLQGRAGNNQLRG